MGQDEQTTKPGAGYRSPDMPTTIRQRHPAALARLDEAWHVGDAVTRITGGSLPVNSLTGAALLLFARIYRAFGAGICIIEEGYGDEAGLQARSLLECLIDLAFITLVDPQERERRIDRYLAYEAVAVFQKAKLAQQFGLAITDTRLEEIERLREEEWDRRFGLPPNAIKGWTGLHIEKRAADVDVTSSYYTKLYKPLSGVTHSSPAAWSALVARTAGHAKLRRVVTGDRIAPPVVDALHDGLLGAATLLAELLDLAPLRRVLSQVQQKRSLRPPGRPHRIPEVRDEMMARYPTALAMLDAAWRQVDSTARALDAARASTPAAQAALILLARVRRALGSGAVLIEEGYADEAGLQARLILECLIDLGYIASADNSIRPARASSFLTSGKDWRVLTIAYKAKEAGLKEVYYDRAYELLSDTTHNRPVHRRTLIEVGARGPELLAGPQVRLDGTVVVALAEGAVRAAIAALDATGADALSPGVLAAYQGIVDQISALGREEEAAR